MRKKVATDGRDALEEFLFGEGKGVANTGFEYDFRRDGDRANVREEGGGFKIPRGCDVHEFSKAANLIAQDFGPAEGLGFDNGKNIGKHLDAATQRVFQELPLGGDELVLVQCGFEGLNEFLRRAGFIEETENAAFVDGFYGGGLVGVAGEHHADGLGGGGLDLDEELDAAHL